MESLRQLILQMADPLLWIPGVIFLLVVGGCYWILRRGATVAGTTPDANAANDGEVALTTASPLPPKPIEKRQFNRRSGNPIEVFVADPDHKHAPAHALLLNRSIGGVRLAVFREAKEGTVLAIRPTIAEEMVPWVDLEVRSCRPSLGQPGEFELSCQFVKTPPYSILLLFG